MDWYLRIAPDGALHVRAGEPTIAGAARLQFPDGSFVEVDPRDPSRLLAMCAKDSASGRWLAATVAGPELEAAFAGDAIPSPCTIGELEPSQDSTAVGRAAVIAHLARHDQPRRRPIWHTEMIAVLATVGGTTSRLQVLPVGVDPQAIGAAITSARTGESFAPEPRAEIITLLEAARGFERLPDELLQSLGTSIVDLRAGDQNRVDELARDLLSDDLFDRLGLRPVPETVMSFDREGTLGEHDSRLTRTPELAIDRGWIPEGIELDLDSVVRITRSGTRCHIEITGASVDPDDTLFARVFDGQGRVHDRQLRHLSRLHHDPEGRTLAADVDLLPEDFSDGSGRLLIDIVGEEEMFEPLSSSHEYWAAATRSDLAVLHLALMEPSRFDDTAIVSMRSDIERHAAELGEQSAGEARRLAGEEVALGFVTPVMLPSPERG